MRVPSRRKDASEFVVCSLVCCRWLVESCPLAGLVLLVGFELEEVNGLHPPSAGAGIPDITGVTLSEILPYKAKARVGRVNECRLWN
ncbi:unnamed protein product [Amoebophrya sp. A25]|nr:unnamed protein product [Amoebophrya sp. A25]|eukprot:GSA25T00023748001.1